MDRSEFCNLLINAKKESGVSLYAIQKKLNLTFQQAKRIETGENNFNMNKAISYLTAINSYLLLTNEDKKFAIKSYEDIVNWIILARKDKYSQRSLAQVVGCTNIAIANTESLKSTLSVDIFLRIVYTLGYSAKVINQTNQTL